MIFHRFSVLFIDLITIHEVLPENCDAYYDYLRATIRTLGDPNLHAVPHLAPINDQTDDLGAGYHPNLRGQCKMAAAVIPYIATLAGWPMPQDRPIR